MPGLRRLALISLSLGACTTTQPLKTPEPPAAAAAEPAPLPAPPPGLTGKDLQGHWRIVSLDGRAPLGGLGGERAPSLVISPHGYGGNSGCNGFGGLGVFDGERYYGGPAMQTLIGCPTLEAQERAILTLIGSAPRVIANGDGRLTLSAGSRTMVIERDTAPLPPQPVDPWRGTPLLAGTKWVLGGIDGAWGNLKGRTLTFEADRWLLASPCGTRGGAWRQTGDRIVADAPDPAPAVSCAAEAAAMDASLVAMIEADPRFVTGPNGEILIGGGGHWVTGDGPRAQLKDDVPLAGTWRIVAIDEAPPAGEGPLQVEFGPSDYSGTTGCNSFQGVYIAHSRRFFSDPPIRTQRACGGPLDAQEKRIAGLLANGPRVAFAGNGDILLVDEGGSLRLSRQTAAGSSPPVGRLWRGEPLEAELIRLDGRPLQSRPSDPVTRLRLSAQRFDINTGCGRFGGIWRVRSGELEFLTDPEPPPEGACAGALAERLSTFSRLFNGRAQVLIGPNGELILAGEQHWLTGRVRRPSTTRR